LERTQLLELANKYGSPIYVYDTDKIESQYNRLTAAFSSVKNLKLNYAVKALSNINILKFFKNIGAGLDTVSIQEVHLGLTTGIDPKKIIFTPNGVSLKEIEEVAKLGVQINIDNLSILELFGQKHPEIPVCVRINPHIMAGGNSKISVGHIDSKFGISIHQVPHIKRVVENTGMNIN
jgi:diaminopimelate decarboxylase